MTDDEMIVIALKSGFYKGMTSDRYPDVEDGTLVCDVDTLREFLVSAMSALSTSIVDKPLNKA